MAGGKAGWGLPPAKLGRRPAKVEPKIRLLIICEGGNTEPSYFEHVVEEFGNNLVEIQIEAAAGVPATLVSKALSAKKMAQSSKDSYAKSDQIWVVFDCDNHVNVKTSISNALSNGIKVAYSNPCFELWALLHLQDYDQPNDQKALQKLLASKMRGYGPKAKRFDYEMLRGQTEAAEKRAAAMCRRREEQRADRGNPYTDVHELVRVIRLNGKR